MKYIIFIVLTLTLLSCSNKKQTDPLSQIESADITIPSAVCEMCAETIEKAAFSLEGVKKVDIELEKKLIHVQYVPIQTNVQTIERAIADAGYDANDQKRNPESYEKLPECCKKD